MIKKLINQPYAPKMGTKRREKNISVTINPQPLRIEPVSMGLF
jgi:hypothetical protein